MHVALLRGINVGGKNKLPMKELVAIFEKEGAVDVKTYIASGNVVFSGKVDAAKVSAAIDKKLKLRVPVVMRTHKELAAALANNPYDESAYLMFLADKPGKKAISELDSQRSPGDEFTVIGREIYLKLVTAAKTKLTNAYFDRVLETVSTSRNMRTVAMLVEMSAE